MAGSKKNKQKKATSALPPPPPAAAAVEDEDLMDDLLAQLDERESATVIKPPVTTPMELTEEGSNIRQASKSRFKARQVRQSILRSHVTTT
jgi:hypothetical protein